MGLHRFYVEHIHASAQAGQERALDSLERELQKVVGCQVDAGN